MSKGLPVRVIFVLIMLYFCFQIQPHLLSWAFMGLGPEKKVSHGIAPLRPPTLATFRSWGN